MTRMCVVRSNSASLHLQFQARMAEGVALLLVTGLLVEPASCTLNFDPSTPTTVSTTSTQVSSTAPHQCEEPVGLRNYRITVYSVQGGNKISTEYHQSCLPARLFIPVRTSRASRAENCALQCNNCSAFKVSTGHHCIISCELLCCY